MKLSGESRWRKPRRRLVAVATLLMLVGGFPSAQASPGDLDTGFSADGKALTDIGTTDSGRSVAVQSDGKIVVAGYALVSGSYDFAVARYDADGDLDNGFSSDGLVTVDLSSTHELAYGVAIQSDGKILVVGTTDYGGVNTDFGIIRLTSSGSLDTTFSSDGIVDVGVGSGNDYATSVDVASDGDIVVAGYGHNGSNWDVGVIRLDSSGNLDTDFSSDGKALYAIGSGHDYGYGLDIASDGDLLVTGSSHNGSDDDVLVLRLDANGVLDTAFDGDGIWTADIGSGTGDVGRGIVEASDGDVLVGGSSDDSGDDILAVRLTSAGVLDTAFSGDGKVTAAIGSGNDVGYGIAEQADGSVVVAGTSHDGSTEDIAVVRFTSAGVLDTGFSGDGKLTTGSGSGDAFGYGVALTSAGKVVVAGQAVGASDTDFAVLVYEGATAPGAPTSLSGTAGDTQVGLSWTAPASNGGSALTGYRVESSTNSGSTWSDEAADTGSTSTSYTATSLTNGTGYMFRVSAINAVGTGTASGTTTATPVTTPGVPTSLSGTAGDTQVGLSWTAPASNGGSALTGYKVESSTNSGSTWSDEAADTGSTSTSYTATSLTNGTGYMFRVSAINAVGTGTASGTTTATPVTTPGVPTSLSGTAGDTQVGLSWTAPASNGGSALTGYKIESSTNSGSTWSTVVADTESTSTTYTTTGLTNGTSYDLRVSAVNVAGTGSASGSTSSTPRTTPGQPTVLAGTPGDGEVSLSWTAPTNDGGASISGYKVESSTNSGSTWTTSIADTGSSSTSAVVDGLSNGTSVTFRVSAINVAGTGSASDTEVTTPRTTPGQPTSLAATEGSTQVSLSWSAPSGDGGSAVTGYRVEQSTNSGLAWTTVVADTGSTSTSYAVTGLTNGSAYSFRVTAVNAAGMGATSSTATATPRTTSDAPTGLAGTPGDRQVALAWTAPSESGGSAVTGYRVERSADGGSTWTAVVADTGSTTTSHSVTGLTNGSAYTFRVSAVNDAGTGSTSSTASATPRTTPGPPTGVASVDGDAQSALTWTAPASDGGAAISGYQVERSTDGGTTWTTVVADTESTSTAYTATGLVNGTSYDFRVSAVNAAGTGTASSTTGASPVAPTTVVPTPSTTVAPPTTTVVPTPSTTVAPPTTTVVPSTSTSTTTSTTTVPGEPTPGSGPPPLPPMVVIDGRIYQDGGIPLPPHYLH
ncbi:MAG: fibronectin type III domain-containing protein [Actinobacteria bacterium]|nr:fibronectin type III domain-containing protein [Actinomycetota bacterium]